jgi:serine/threonine protein kinase
MGPELKDLINQLLKFNPDERLGAAGYDQIKSHPFFKDTDWNKLLKKELPSPLLPILVACPFKTAEIKGRPFIKKTLSFNLDLDNEWTYDCKL